MLVTGQDTPSQKQAFLPYSLFNRGTSYSSTLPHPPEKSVDEDPVPPPRPNPFVRHPSFRYVGFFAPTFALSLLSLAFIIYLRDRGAIAASRRITSYVLDRPRQTAQVVTILASALTATIRWSLKRSATLLAQKRIFQQFRSIFEIEAFDAIKNIAVLRGWHHRKRLLLTSWILVLACGFLTSGFVALFSPLPIEKHTKISGIRELDFSSNADSCSLWHDQSMNILMPETGSGRNCTYHLHKDFFYSSCMVADYLPQLLNAASASVLGHFSSFHPPDKHTTFVSSYSTLNYTRILGGTAGILPYGPAGVQAFSFPNISLTSNNFTYTLKHQGIWVDTSCAYEYDSKLRVTVLSTGAGADIVEAVCPDGSQTQQYIIPNKYVRFGVTIVHPCVSQDATTLYWRDFNIDGAQSGSGVDYVRCELTPRIGDVEAKLDTDIAAFKLQKVPSSYSPFPRFARSVHGTALGETWRIIVNSQTEIGNLVRDVIQSFALTYGGLGPETWTKPNKVSLKLIELVTQGMFELQASHTRLMLQAIAESDLPAPAECFRSVEGEMIERLIGWNIQESTLLGLIPLLIVFAVTLAMIVGAIGTRGPLTLFDPTSAVSLIAATNLGDVKFRSDNPEIMIVGDPLDKAVGHTKIAYGDYGGKWCLKSE